MLLLNGRTAVHKQSGGILTTISINLTGPRRTPVPYPNIAKSADATNTADRVRCNGNPICHQQSYFSKSTGDEAGIHGGIKSGTVNGIAEFITGSDNILINGIPVVRANDLMVSNNRNTEPAPLIQPE